MSDDTAQGQRSTVLVLTPAADDAAAQGIEDPHITLAYLNDGSTPMDPQALGGLRLLCDQVAGVTSPFQMSVSGAAYLGPDKARVLLLESGDLKALRDALMSSSAMQAAVAVDPFPFFIPHMTLGYEGTDLPEEPPASVSGVALGLWVQGQKESFPLTGDDAPQNEIDLLVPVASAADLPLGIRVADQHPAGRWYVTKRARALGLEHCLPPEWGAA